MAICPLARKGHKGAVLDFDGCVAPSRLTLGIALMPPLLVLPFPALDPVLVSIGPFAIRWYALAYIGGILLGWLYARALIRAEQLWGGTPPLALEDIDDFILWV